MLATDKYFIQNFRENSLQSILKTFDLDTERLAECVTILQEWIDSQNHFNKKTFIKNFLESTIISCKGSVERAKSRLDKYCTLRTTVPRFFDKVDANADFTDMHQAYNVAILPQCTKDLYRVMIIKINNKNLNLSTALDFYKFGTIILEYLKAYDLFYGAVVVIDYTDINILEILPNLNPIDLSEALKLYMDGYGMRIQGIHFLTSSKLIEIVVSTFKSVLSAKVGKRIQVHTSAESLHQVIPKEILPLEYGGKKKSFYSICDDWIKVLSSEDHQEYLTDMKNAYTNESYRVQSDEFDSNCDTGLQGTFRTLVLD